MREQSATRRELEEKMRALIPSRLADAASSNPAVAGAGFTGLVSGFFWGWLRGRRKRPKSTS